MEKSLNGECSICHVEFELRQITDKTSNELPQKPLDKRQCRGNGYGLR